MKYKQIKTDELKLIRQLREKRLPLSKISEIIGRSPNSISDICRNYGLPNNRWTPEEEQLLVQSNYSARQLKEKLGRSLSAIYTRKSRLNKQIN